MNKKGIELSINFIVILIISITLFIFGIIFITNLGGEAVSLKSLTLQELDDQIDALMCEGQDRVCIGEDRKTIQKGDVEIFGIRITNVLSADTNFVISVSRPSPGGFTKNNAPITNDNLRWMPRSRSVKINRFEEQTIGIGIEVPKNAAPGTYIFDVDIQPYGELYKFYVNVPY